MQASFAAPATRDRVALGEMSQPGFVTVISEPPAGKIA